MPTDKDHDAAKAFLEAWVPGYTVGQWAALGELLAACRERESTPTPSREQAA